VLTFNLKPLYNKSSLTCITTLSTIPHLKYSRVVVHHNMKFTKSDGITNLISASIIPNQDIPIFRSTHPLDLSISDKDIDDLQHIYHNVSILLQQEKRSPDLHLYQMLSHNSQVTDISLNHFLAYLGNSLPSIVHLPTYFSSELFDKGWENSAHKYFSLPNSSTCRGIQKPTLSSPIILIPVHIHGCHWIALMRHIINDRVHFYYADDMLSPHASSCICERFSQSKTSSDFHPNNARWVCCSGIEFSPHSNKYGPLTLLSLTIMTTHPSPHGHMIIPWLHPNITLISRWLVT